MKVQESAEMYLETILVLTKRSPNVRSIDVATELNYKKSSVSVAMKNLRENGFISMDEGGYLKLSEKGQQIAETILERHILLSEWLMRLGVNEDIAVEDACRMEHIISAESFEAIKRHANGTKI